MQKGPLRTMGMELDIQTKKQKALDFFLNELLKTEAMNSIARIVLFGSLLKGETKEESDIDLLVVSLDSLPEVSKACADASFETAMATGESMEPIVRCIDKEARNYLDLASEYLDGSRANFEKRFLRIAIDAGYNACELAIKGLLFLKLPDIPGPHGGIVNKFGELFVKTGEVPKEMGREISLALKKKNNARYEPHAQMTKETAEEIISLGERLRRVLEKKLEK